VLLLAEDLLLLLTDDRGRLSAPSAEVDVLLVGANLVELALMGKVAFSLGRFWDRTWHCSNRVRSRPRLRGSYRLWNANDSRSRGVAWRPSSTAA
jgi:hypothetical protein